MASRTLHGLALDGHAPSIFLKLNRFHIPYIAVSASVIWGALAYLTLNDGASQVGVSSRLILFSLISSVNQKVFMWLVSLVTTAGILSWIVIGVTYLRFYNALRVQDIPRDRLPYKSPFQPYITVCDFFFSLKGLVFRPLDSTMALL